MCRFKTVGSIKHWKRCKPLHSHTLVVVSHTSVATAAPGRTDWNVYLSIWRFTMFWFQLALLLWLYAIHCHNFEICCVFYVFVNFISKSLDNLSHRCIWTKGANQFSKKWISNNTSDKVQGLNGDKNLQKRSKKSVKRTKTWRNYCVYITSAEHWRKCK